jgi:signal transduction histidine kinase
MKRRIPKEAHVLQLMQNAIEASEQLAREFEEVREYSASLKPKYALTDLRNLINEAWGQLMVEAQHHNVELIVSSGNENTYVEVDQFLVTNSFRNIFQNALDAMNDNGTVRVTFQETQVSEAPHLSIIFEDNGRGISEEEAIHAFEAFYSTKTRGTGLGLAIVKRYIEAHGGTVMINPTQRGSRAILTLPLSPSDKE